MPFYSHDMDHNADNVQSTKQLGHHEDPGWLTVVRSQVESLKFGTVQITVHDSKVVQIERNEKTRLDRFNQT